jgi:D-alanine-D-alanine ligase
MKEFGKVAVLMGGTSAERVVSLDSGNAVLSALRGKGVAAQGLDAGLDVLSQLMQGEFDRVFIALHGRGGEDGQIQGALQTLGLPFTGSGVLGSALAMDKWRTKLVWQASGISTPRFVLLNEDSDFEGVAKTLGLPLIVKPAREGSTIGLTKVSAAADIKAAYRLAAGYDAVILAEEFIEGRELTASILGSEVLPLIQIIPASGLYDYEAKYLLNDTQYLCPCGLPEAEERAIQRMALDAFRVLGCQGWGRVDLILDQKGTPYFLEANTVPGMTGHSLVPMAAKAAGVDFDQLVLRILETSGTAIKKPARQQGSR